VVFTFGSRLSSDTTSVAQFFVGRTSGSAPGGGCKAWRWGRTWFLFARTDNLLRGIFGGNARGLPQSWKPQKRYGVLFPLLSDRSSRLPGHRDQLCGVVNIAVLDHTEYLM
jgi:hypothetical protein